MSIRLFTYIIWISIIIFISSCYSDYSKKEYRYSKQIGSEVSAEFYRVANYGVGGDVFSVYVTDSLIFRKFITLFYDHESVSFEIVDDQIIAIREEWLRSPTDSFASARKISEFNFSYSKLKEEGVFD